MSIEKCSQIQMIISFREFVPEELMLEKIEDVLRGKDGR
jgi:hypothetical protein